MENAGYLFTAFSLVWILLFVYVMVLFIRQKKLREEINTLRESLKDKN
jgi:CcmD family protein